MDILGNWSMEAMTSTPMACPEEDAAVAALHGGMGKGRYPLLKPHTPRPRHKLTLLKLCVCGSQPP